MKYRKGEGKIAAELTFWLFDLNDGYIVNVGPLSDHRKDNHLWLDSRDGRLSQQELFSAFSFKQMTSFVTCLIFSLL